MKEACGIIIMAILCLLATIFAYVGFERSEGWESVANLFISALFAIWVMFIVRKLRERCR